MNWITIKIKFSILNFQKDLTKGKLEFKSKELFKILNDNDIDENEIDVVSEAFYFFDPFNTGYISAKRLKHIFSALNIGSLK